MFWPLRLLALGRLGGGTEPPPQPTVLKSMPILDPMGINLGMASLTNNVAAQAPFAAAVQGAFPSDGTISHLRSNTYGIGSATGVYPVWSNAGCSYWINMFRWPEPGNFGDNRFLCAEPLAGYLNTGVTSATAPFGRDANKLQVANTANTWRNYIRWRHRVLLSTEVGVVTSEVSAADLAAARNTNARTLSIVGPNEIDHPNNWKYYYLNYTVQPDEITSSETIGQSITRADTIFSASLNLLFVRIIDHMRYTFEAINDPLTPNSPADNVIGGAARTNCAAIMPSIISVAINKSNGCDFTIYDIMNFEDTSANVNYRRGDFFKWCDAGQVHIHVNHYFIPNPFDTNPLSVVNQVITPWHYWKAKLDNEAWRISQGLDPLKRPLVNGETGVPHQGDGIPLDWRPAQFQLRRLKLGQLLAGNVYYACSMILTYSAGMSTNYGYNYLWHPTPWTVDTYSIDAANRGAGYTAGVTYNTASGVAGMEASFRVVTVGTGGSVQSIRINHTGFFNTQPAANIPLATPSGGTACRLNIVYKKPSPHWAVGDLGVRDCDDLRSILNYRQYDLSKFPKINDTTFSIPIVGKTWKEYHKDWMVWMYQTQDPIDDVPTAFLAANRCHMANTALSSGNNRNSIYRCAYWSTKAGAINGIRLVYANTLLSSSGEAAVGNTVYVTASVEYNGVTRPVTFGGVREGTMGPGAVITSDAVDVTIPANTQFYVRNNARTANATEKFAVGYSPRTDWGEGWTLSGPPTTTVDGVGLLPSNGSAALFSPTGVLATSVQGNPARFVIIGSSSSFGQGENFGALAMPGDRGYLSRLVSNNYGQCVIAAPGQTIQQFLTNNALRMAAIAALQPTHIIMQMGANDVNAGLDAATLQVRLQNMWAILKPLGAKIIQCTFTTTATSTDGFTTVANQTPTNHTARTQINNFIRTVPSPIGGFLDVQRVTESSVDSGRWRVDGGAWTTDGTHTIRHGEIAAALNLNSIL